MLDLLRTIVLLVCSEAIFAGARAVIRFGG
jgi:hypothetical protein